MSATHGFEETHLNQLGNLMFAPLLGTVQRCLAILCRHLRTHATRKHMSIDESNEKRAEDACLIRCSLETWIQLNNR